MSVLLVYQWLRRDDEQAEAVVTRVVHAIEEAGFGPMKVETAEASVDEVAVLCGELDGAESLAGELQVLVRPMDMSLWQGHRLQLTLPARFAGRQAPRCRDAFVAIGVAIDCVFGGLFTADRGIFQKPSWVDLVGAPPTGGWLTLLDEREYGPWDKDLRDKGDVAGSHHLLVQAAPPPWDHGNLHAARALVEQTDALSGRLTIARSIEARLEIEAQREDELADV